VKTKSENTKLYHLAYYVEDSTPAMRKFNSLKDMRTFFREFEGGITVADSQFQKGAPAGFQQNAFRIPVEHKPVVQ